MAYVTGKNGVITLTGQNGFCCNLEWTETYDIVTNSSMITIDKFQLKTTLGSPYYDEYYLDGTVKIGGNDAIVMVSRLGTHYIGLRSWDVWKNVVDGERYQSICPLAYGPIYHDVYGKKTVSIDVNFRLASNNSGTGSGSKISGTQTIALTDIPRFATITSAPNFNDDEKPTIIYSNPAGANVTSLQACITLDGSNPNVDASVAVAYRNIPVTGTSYTFDDITPSELYAIYYTMTNSNSRQVYFKIKTVIGDTVGYSQVERTLNIANPNPTVNPIIIDTDDTVTKITGDNKILVKYYSNASVTSNASAVKYSTLTSTKVTCGSKSITSQNGVINDIDSGTFTFYAKDSRGNETTKTITPSSGVFSFIDYVRPTCVIANHLPDTDGKMFIEVSGNYYNGNIGKTPNTLTVQYRYKPVGGSYSAWKTITSRSLNGTLYYSSTEESGLDYQTAYVFQARAIDIFEEAYSIEKTVKSTPVFDWGENDFKFNVPVYDEFGTVIRNGKAAYTGSGTNSIDPNTTTEELCYTDHANVPRPGQWFFIRTMIYDDPVGPDAKSQLAVPSGAPMSVYHRYYSSDSGWSSWRRHLNEDEHYTQIKLLWHNASSGFNTEFPAQSIYIPGLVDYDFAIIISDPVTVICANGAVSQIYVRDTYYPCSRQVIWFGDCLDFGDAVQHTSCPGSDTVVANYACIPYYIYGIKGAFE